MTPEEKAAQELEQKRLEAIKAAVKSEVDPLKAKIEAQEKEIKTLNDNNLVLKTKVDTFEKLPAFQAPAVGASKEYRGYKIAKLLSGGAEGGTSLREIFSKGKFGVLSREEAQDDFAKNMLDILKACDRRRGNNIILGDPEAKQAMEERRQNIIKASAIAKTNANNEGTASEGGYLVQPEYQWDIVKLSRDRSYALQLARIVNMVSNVQYIPDEATLGAMTWENEGAQKTPSEPTFAQTQLTAKKAFNLARVTNEELADTSIDIVGLITEQFSYALAQGLDDQWLNGNGSPWSGMLSTIVTSVILATTGSISGLVFTDLSNALAQIADGRLDGLSWLMGPNAKHYVRSLKDTSGRPIFAMPGNGVPGTIWEYPYYLSMKMPNGLGASVKSILLGNFNYSLIGRRQGVMNIDVDPYGMFDYDVTRFRMVTRWAHAIPSAANTVAGSTAFCLIKTS